AQDTVGFNLQSDKIWSFATAFRPFVSTVTPLDGTTGVNRATTIRATFSKDIDPTTIENPATTFILFIDNNSNNSYDAGTDTLIPGNVTYDTGTYTATFTPDSDLGYSAYTATITTGVEDPDGIAMGAAKTWDFSTLPTLNEPLITSNRIVSGGNQQALIFVTEPPGGPSDRVSVQVFTTSGRRVATLVNNLPFSSIGVPIVWDGTNGRGEKLGPGLYFVQIRAAGYKRVLKVMIVR
ncbi:MAG: Ig-like domain-containing protein, partial [Spirochaetaceae bacterium]